MLDLFRQQRLDDPDAIQRQVLRRELWAGRQRQGSKRSQIAFMKPGCQLIFPEKASSLSQVDKYKTDLVLFVSHLQSIRISN